MQKPLKFLCQQCTCSIHSSSLVSSVSGISSLPIFLFSLFFLTLFSPQLCLAEDVTLGWTANALEENVQGYKIYVGTSSRYDDNHQLKNSFQYEYVVDLNTKLSCTLPGMDNCVKLWDNKLQCAVLDNENPTCTFLNLAENTDFYFTVTAFNDLSESDYSTEAAYLPEIPETDEVTYLPNVSETDTDGDNVISLLDNVSGEGVFVGTAQFNHNWQTVNFNPDLLHPVVIVGPPSYNGPHPGVIRLRNVASHSFDIHFQEWNYLDGSHALEDASWLALEPGRYEMADGTICEVGTFSMNSTGEWFDVDFLESFDGIPALFLTIQTFNGSDAVTVRARDVDTSFFSAAFFEEEANSGHATEVVGYLAIYSPDSSGTITINGQSVAYETDFVGTNNSFRPIFDYDIFVEEEQSADDEIVHAYETVNVLRLNNSFFSQDVSVYGSDTAAIRYQK